MCVITGEEESDIHFYNGFGINGSTHTLDRVPNCESSYLKPEVTKITQLNLPSKFSYHTQHLMYQTYSTGIFCLVGVWV